MCVCGENLVSIICLEIFSASLWNLYSTGTFQKAFLINEPGWGEGNLWSRRDQVLVVHGTACSSLLWAGQNSPFSCPSHGVGSWLGSFGSLCPMSLLLFNTKGLESSPGRGPGSLCLSDPLNFIRNELLNPLDSGDTGSFTRAFPMLWSGGIFLFPFEESTRRTKGWVFMAWCVRRNPYIRNQCGCSFCFFLPHLSCRRVVYSEGTETPWFMGLR